MLLYHCFKRRYTNSAQTNYSESLDTLKSILSIGLLCSYENLSINLDPELNSPNLSESDCLDNEASTSSNSTCIPQSRACFTLLERDELFLPIQRAVTNGKAQKSSHIELFGPISIGIDPVKARDLGILPVHYYYPHNHNELNTSGLSNQFVFRLLELREICAILAILEAKVGEIHYEEVGQSVLFPNEVELRKKWGVDIDHEPDITQGLKILSPESARKIVALFQVDRIRAAGLHDFVNMILSSVQTADSSFESSYYEFYQQREWRLIHHERTGLEWFCLSKDSEKVSSATGPIADWRAEIIKNYFTGTSSRTLNLKLQHGWVLTAFDGLKFSNVIKEIITPHELTTEISGLLLESFPTKHIRLFEYSENFQNVKEVFY